MSHHHHHGHSHDHHGHHHHGDVSSMNQARLLWAIIANMMLTVAQVIGGIISGSLSLVADALHNFSDAASLVLAYVAIRIGQKPADHFKTFGYKRAETIAALINLVTLVLIGFFLCYEAIIRFFAPEPIMGWLVVFVATVALVIDVFTALLVYRQSKTSMNMHAAFLHNLTDAAASVGVIVAGTLIILYQWYWVDAFMTLVIAGFVLWHGVKALPNVIHLLMNGVPNGVVVQEIVDAMDQCDGVRGVHHVHVWQVDEQRNALEAHVVLNDGAIMDDVKMNLKRMLNETFGIVHSTLEFENTRCSD